MSDYYNSSTAAANSSRWLADEVFRLIEVVQRDEAIYNPRHKYYFCRPYVENFWREVDLKLEKNPGASLAKWTNLRISFRREYTNYLEEKVPPCWSYFDRMFFLHPYLRKKHQQPKSLDSQVQDALVQISSLSSRLQRERAVAALSSQQNMRENSPGPSNAVQPAGGLDNYLDYFDEPEPQNSSELDDIIAEEQQARFPVESRSINNDIKSECEDAEEDFGENRVNRPMEPDLEEEDDEDFEEIQADDENEIQRLRNSYNNEVTAMRSIVLNSLHSAQQSSASAASQNRHHLRMQHLNRLQTRSYHEDLRAKRPRSQENISSSSSNSCQNRSAANVSFVRPTFSKPPVSSTINECVSTSSNAAIPAVSSNINASNLAIETESLGLRHNRLEISAVTSATAAAASSVNAGSSSDIAASSPSNAHVELCDCKTDPDAMFLMSLLPDIQKLNGRDRGKIKIAFQHILQDYLYPD